MSATALSALAIVAAAAVTGAFALLAARLSGKANREHTFVDNLLRRIEQCERREGDLLRRVDDLEAENDKARRIAAAAAEWIRAALRSFRVHDIEPPPLPPELREG